MTAQTPFDKVLGVSNLKMLRYEWIWEKEVATGFLNSKKAPLKKHENVLVFCKKGSIYNPQFTKGEPYKTINGRLSSNYGNRKPAITDNDGLRYPVSVLKFGRIKERIHPTQKPVALFEYLIKTYTNKGDLVLDNCMGSGTTAIAALNTERNFIGFEIDKGYYDKSIERINDFMPLLYFRENK